MSLFKKICLMTFSLTLMMSTITRAEIGNKRIPSGFQGMRGKKSIEYVGYDPDNTYLGTANIPYDQVPDESRLTDLENDLLLQEAYDRYGSLKRAPVGFQGLRGKKNYMMDTGPYEDIFDEDHYDKRAPILGFQGMRGKREFEYAPFFYAEEKRTPKGFQGMRGKKSDDEMNKSTSNISGEQPVNGFDAGLPSNSDEELLAVKQRRAAQNLGFYGVRGKKMPVSWFYGMRGKKGPYDLSFKSKFVGVRGKKTYEARPEELQMFADKLSWNTDSYEKRKGPNGFMGMRGKKWIAPDSAIPQTNNGIGEN